MAAESAAIGLSSCGESLKEAVSALQAAQSAGGGGGGGACLLLGSAVLREDDSLQCAARIAAATGARRRRMGARLSRVASSIRLRKRRDWVDEPASHLNGY
jgi:hypothetical protein